jgi:hypothetical protein
MTLYQSIGLLLTAIRSSALVRISSWRSHSTCVRPTEPYDTDLALNGKRGWRERPVVESFRPPGCLRVPHLSSIALYDPTERDFNRVGPIFKAKS